MSKMSVILLGDSIFDNQVYVPGEPCVHTHLSRELEEQVTLLAVDGAVTSDVLSDQVFRIPESATHLVLSVGGNDAIQAFYNDPSPEALKESALEFEVQYAELIGALQGTGLPLCACTIYCDCPLDEDPMLSYAMRHYLPWYNAAIESVLARYAVPLIDLREICTEPEDYLEYGAGRPTPTAARKQANRGGMRLAPLSLWLFCALDASTRSMKVLEFKARVVPAQAFAINEAIRTAQFVRNKCLRLWMDVKGKTKYDLNKYCKVLASQFEWAKKLNSQARQSSAEQAWSSISNFYRNCTSGVKPVGYPRFKKQARSVEYKTTGWKLLDLKRIQFTDGFKIGTVRLIGTYDLGFYQPEQIKRVRIVRRADGYYVQFVLSVEEPLNTRQPTGKTVGLDVGLEHFYTDSNGHHEPVQQFYRKSQIKRKRLQRRLSRKAKGSKNRVKARQRLARHELKISKQRKEYAKRLAYCVIQANDLVAYEDLRIRNMVKNHCLAKAIQDAGWYQFRLWLEYFGQKYGTVTVAVDPAYTSQECPSCGAIVKKSLSTRTHVCACGCELQRDHAAAINILRRGLRTVGHMGTWLLDSQNAWGETTATVSRSGGQQQVVS